MRSLRWVLHKTNEEVIPIETFVTLQELSKQSGISYAQLAAWTKRIKDPLPHIKCGNKTMTRISALENWLDKEMDKCNQT